jgi:hypothetical protein
MAREIGTKQLQFVFWPGVAAVAVALTMMIVVAIRGEGPRPIVDPAQVIVPATSP